MAADGKKYYTPEKGMTGSYAGGMGSHSTDTAGTSKTPGPVQRCKTLCLDDVGSKSEWPKGEMLYSVIAIEWPELTYGRIVTGMIDELRARKLLFVLGANARVMIVLPEVISPGKVATLAQQFGEGTDEQDLLELLDVLTPSMLQYGHEMEQAVVNKSAAALNQEVTRRRVYLNPKP
jgi:hypothetical protein